RLVAQVARPGEETDDLVVRRLVADDWRPSPVVEPVPADVRRRRGRGQLTAVPELDDRGTVPLGQRRIHAHAERVLQRAAATVSEGKVAPPVRSSTPIEVDFECLGAEGDGRDLR